MTTRNVSRLESGLIARKGEASPALEVPASPMAPSAQHARNEVADVPEPVPSPSPRGVHGTIAVTVRLDPQRYERLKIYGARRRQTNQNILVEALDRFLATSPE